MTRRCLVVVLREDFGGGKDMEEIVGRMAFHFVMVLVGLLEASIAAKREQDYCLPIEWKLRWSTFSTEIYYSYQIHFSLIYFLLLQYLHIFSFLS